MNVIEFEISIQFKQLLWNVNSRKSIGGEKMKVPHFYIPTYMHTYIHFDVCYFIVLQSIGNSYFHLKFLWPPFFVCVWNRRYSFFGKFFWFRFDCGFSDIKENVNIISSLCLKSIVLRSHIYVSHWIVYIYFFSCLI